MFETGKYFEEKMAALDAPDTDSDNEEVSVWCPVDDEETGVAYSYGMTRSNMEWVLNRSGSKLRYVRNQTPQLAHTAVVSDPNALEFVENQTPCIVLLALSLKPSSFQYVKEKTPAICRIALSLDGLNLQYLKSEQKTVENCSVAIKETLLAVQYLPKITPELWLEILKWRGEEVWNSERLRVSQEAYNQKLKQYLSDNREILPLLIGYNKYLQAIVNEVLREEQE